RKFHMDISRLQIARGGPVFRDATDIQHYEAAVAAYVLWDEMFQTGVALWATAMAHGRNPLQHMTDNIARMWYDPAWEACLAMDPIALAGWAWTHLSLTRNRRLQDARRRSGEEAFLALLPSATVLA